MVVGQFQSSNPAIETDPLPNSLTSSGLQATIFGWLTGLVVTILFLSMGSSWMQGTFFDRNSGWWVEKAKNFAQITLPVSGEIVVLEEPDDPPPPRPTIPSFKEWCKRCMKDLPIDATPLPKISDE